MNVPLPSLNFCHKSPSLGGFLPAANSQIITPNDDKVNDATSISFDLFGLNGGRLNVAIYDLAGQQVNTLLATEALAGPYAPIWDGTDQGRKRVPPGLYLVRIEVDVDEGNFTTVQPIAVAY